MLKTKLYSHSGESPEGIPSAPESRNLKGLDSCFRRSDSTILVYSTILETFHLTINTFDGNFRLPFTAIWLTIKNQEVHKHYSYTPSRLTLDNLYERYSYRHQHQAY